MWKGPVGFAEMYSRRIFSFSIFSGRPKFSRFLKISSTASARSSFPALKFIKPPITEYSLPSSAISETIAFAIIGGAILAVRASDETFTAKSPKSGFLGFSTTSEPFVYSFICPSLFSLTAFNKAFSIFSIK